MMESPTRTVVQVSDRDYLLYTEGRRRRKSRGPLFGHRLHFECRLRTEARYSGIRTILRQVNDLSQVNWRGFNARSKLFSIYYGSLIAGYWLMYRLQT